MLQPLAEDLWIADQPLRFLGVEVGARMTVVRLPGGKLWLHSPIRPTRELRAAVDALGEVAFVVAPNRFHHLFAGDWLAAYPRAELHLAHGLAKKRPDLHATAELGDAPAGFSAALDHVAWRGSPALNEVAFLHRATGTLIVADLVHNVGPEKPLLSRAFYGLLGGYGGLKTNALDRLVARDRPAARASLEKILAWKFDRIVMSHGRVFESGGADGLRAAYRWLVA